MANIILIADDEPDLLEILSYNLEKEDFDVTTVQNGKATVAALDEHPDVIILDIMMPEMNDFEACKQIRKQNNAVPVIFLTAKDSEFDEVLGMELGADDYITKHSVRGH